MSAIPATPAGGSVADRVDLGAQLRWLSYLHRIGATTDQIEAATRPILARVERASAAVADREAEHDVAADAALGIYRAHLDAGAKESDARGYALNAIARTATNYSGESGRQREAAVLAEPVTDAHIDTAPTSEVRDLLIRAAAAQQALRKLAGTHADTAADVIGLYNEGQHKSGYDPDQAAAAAMTEASTGIPAVYENAYYYLDYRAGQRAQQPAETTTAVLDGQAIADIAREATAHNFGRTVWNVDSPESGAVRVRMSSWPRQREAAAALREHGYAVHYDGTILVITDRAPHEQAQATIAQARAELRHQILERQRAVDEGLRYARLYLAVRGSNGQADAERVRRAAAERYADSAATAPITATWIDASPAIDQPSLVGAAADLHAAAALRRGHVGAVDHAARSYLDYRSRDMDDIASSDTVRRDAADDVQREIDFSWRDTHEGLLGFFASTEHAEQVQQRAHIRIEVHAGERAQVDPYEFAQPVPGRPDDLDQLRRRQIDAETPAATATADEPPTSAHQQQTPPQQTESSARQTERTRDSASLLGAYPAAPIHPQLLAAWQRAWTDAANQLRDQQRQLTVWDWRLRAALADFSARRYNGAEDQVQALNAVIARSQGPRHRELYTAAVALRDTAPTDDDNRDLGSFAQAARRLAAAGARPAALNALHAAVAANEPLAGIDASDIYIHAPQLFQQWTTEQNPANRERVAERIATVVDLARRTDTRDNSAAEGRGARLLAESLDQPLEGAELLSDVAGRVVPLPATSGDLHLAAGTMGTQSRESYTINGGISVGAEDVRSGETRSGDATSAPAADHPPADDDTRRPDVAETRGSASTPPDPTPRRIQALEDRWAPSARAVDPRVVADLHWPALARSLDRLEATGHDVDKLLREMTAQRALPAGNPARSLDYRLADAAPDTGAVPGQPWTAAPTSTSTPTSPISTPQMGRGGPAR
jgi:hypothetical protein